MRAVGGRNARARRRLVASSTAESSRSEIPFSSSFRTTASAMPESSASSSSPAVSRSSRSALKAALASVESEVGELE